jgi:hypothetical protein
MPTQFRKTLIQLAVASACGVLAIPGQAQDGVTTVVVSGSRIAARGFSQPTPTTTLTADDLAKAAKPNLFETLIDLPALQGSTGRTTFTYSTSSGVQGLSSLSLTRSTPSATRAATSSAAPPPRAPTAASRSTSSATCRSIWPAGRTSPR